MEYQNTSHLTRQKSKSTKKIIIIIVVAVILLLGIGTFMFRNSEQSADTITPTPVQITEAPTPTEEPQIDKASVKIQVLNGTGTPGQAGTAVEALTNAGYSEDQITTDNASEYDHAVTIISMQEGYEEIADDIEDSLSGLFDSIEIDSTILGASEEFNIIVITGGETFVQETSEAVTSTPSATTNPESTPKPTASPTETPTPTLSASLTPSPTAN